MNQRRTKMYVFIMYGAGGNKFSSQLESELATKLRKISGIKIPPVFDYTEVEIIKKKIYEVPSTERNPLCVQLIKTTPSFKGEMISKRVDSTHIDIIKLKTLQNQIVNFVRYIRQGEIK
jgi:hypothetical protein